MKHLRHQAERLCNPRNVVQGTSRTPSFSGISDVQHKWSCGQHLAVVSEAMLWKMVEPLKRSEGGSFVSMLRMNHCRVGLKAAPL